MNQSEAQAIFLSKTKEEADKLYAEIKDASAKGLTSLIYYPSTFALLKSVMAEMNTQEYWAKEVRENNWCNQTQANELIRKGEIFCYREETDNQGTRLYRSGLKIWWSKPGFWEWHF